MFQSVHSSFNNFRRGPFKFTNGDIATLAFPGFFNLQPFATFSIRFQPFPTFCNLLQPTLNLSNLYQTFLNLSKLIQTYPTFSFLLEPSLALLLSFLTLSNHLQSRVGHRPCEEAKFFIVDEKCCRRR